MFFIKNFIIFILLITSIVWAEEKWEQKKLNFEAHMSETYQRKESQRQAKKVYEKYKKQLKKEKDQLKWKTLSHRLHTNNQETAQQLFHMFLKPHQKNPLKQEFIKQRKKEQKLKEKYKIPLEQRLFL